MKGHNNLPCEKDLMNKNEMMNDASSSKGASRRGVYGVPGATDAQRVVVP
jgi:hypothetical protein